MKSAAMLLVVTGLLLSGSSAVGGGIATTRLHGGPAAVVRVPTFDGQWLARIGGTMTRPSTGSTEPYVRMGYVTVKGATVSQFLTGRINLATGLARLHYVYYPGRAPCSVTVRFRTQGTAKGVTPLRCVMNLGASGVWSLTATVTLNLSSRG
jgi:hypothetical protein